MSDLTTIRVRGKRRKPNHEAQSSAATATGARTKPGRPLMSLREKQLSAQARLKRRQGLVETSISAYMNANSNGDANADAYSQFQTRKARNLSNLECLPVELIEKIFLYSLNVNLPRCSLSLRAAVSSERVYRVLILLAFWRDPLSGQGNGNGKGNEAVARILRPLDYVPLDEEERRALQSTVLRCRWCTFPRVLGQLPDLMHLALQRYWTDAGIYMDSEQQENLSRFLAREDAVQSQDNTRLFHGTGTGQDANHYTLSITPLLSITVTNLETDQQTTHPLISLREFPDKLLRGDPNGIFSNGHITFLETLRVAGGFNREEQQCMLEANMNVSLSRHVLQEGIHNALVQNNPQALVSLLKIDEYFARCEIAATTTTDNTSLPYTIPSEHFRTAIRSSSNTQTQSTLFHHLLRANAESVPPDDAEVTQWAMDFNDVFGHWLLDFMLRLPQQVEAARANPRDEGLFYMGRGNGNVEMGRRFLSDVLGVEELGGWMGETGVDFGALWVGDNDSWEG